MQSSPSPAAHPESEHNWLQLTAPRPPTSKQRIPTWCFISQPNPPNKKSDQESKNRAKLSRQKWTNGYVSSTVRAVQTIRPWMQRKVSSRVTEGHQTHLLAAERDGSWELTRGGRRRKKRGRKTGRDPATAQGFSRQRGQTDSWHWIKEGNISLCCI